MRDIRTLDIKEIERFIADHGEKKFRAQQIYQWIWNKHVDSLDAMTDVPISLRQLLKQHFFLSHIHIVQKQMSSDGTIKVAFSLSDGEMIEGVLIPSGNRLTACISVQAGCPLKCLFCATGSIKYKRNLSCAEIVDQVILLNRTAAEQGKNKISNIVIMGMGEPLLNYDAVKCAMHKITSPDIMGMSPSRITLSTAGITENIIRMADEAIGCNLAISLHTADARQREILMPVSKSNPLPTLAEAIIYYHKKKQKRVTFEYLLLHNFNDSEQDAQKLAAFCRIVPCKVNLIEFNPVEGCNFKKSSPERMKKFKAILESKNMIVNLRQSRGKDINAACGQLANKLLR